jgi:hypothetical protein
MSDSRHKDISFRILTATIAVFLALVLLYVGIYVELSREGSIDPKTIEWAPKNFITIKNPLGPDIIDTDQITVHWNEPITTIYAPLLYLDQRYWHRSPWADLTDHLEEYLRVQRK